MKTDKEYNEAMEALNKFREVSDALVETLGAKFQELNDNLVLANKQLSKLINIATNDIEKYGK